MGQFVIVSDKKAILACNLITTAGRDSLINVMADNSGPNWDYVAVGAGTAASGSADTALAEEFYRVAVGGRYTPNPGTIRLVGIFSPYVAAGDWGEVGIFDSDMNRTVTSECQGTSGWTSGGALTQELTTVIQGQASLRTAMGSTATLAYLYNAAGAGNTHTDFGTASCLQFWYRSSANPGTLTVQVGRSSSHYYQFAWAPGTVDTWHHFHKTFSQASGTVGTPSSGTLMQMNHFKITHPTVAEALYYEYLDYISVHTDAGTLLARGTISLTKSWNTVVNVYYSVKVAT